MEKEVKERKVRGQYCGKLRTTENTEINVFYSRPHFLAATEKGNFIKFLPKKLVRKSGLLCPDSIKVIYNQKGYVGPTRSFSESVQFNVLSMTKNCFFIKEKIK